MIESEASVAAGRNLDYAWDAFDPETYFRHNYVILRDDDRKIVELVRNFFAATLAASPLSPGARGIDVGTGANLYPALTMLPFCDRITLYEFSAANVDWLEHQRERGWPSWHEAWDQFWILLCKQPAYQGVAEPQSELAGRAEIVQGSIFELQGQDPADRWDIGTMFFVAESITGQRREFLKAVDHFFTILKPNAPFAMAFMEHSAGYHVGLQNYPATDIDERDIEQCLGDRAHDIRVHNIGSGNRPLRDGYTGMILAHGRVNRKNR
jgi:hypothetical protein